jgi:hypothetical protein
VHRAEEYGNVVHIAVDPNSDGDIYVKFRNDFNGLPSCATSHSRPHRTNGPLAGIVPGHMADMVNKIPERALVTPVTQDKGLKDWPVPSRQCHLRV